MQKKMRMIILKRNNKHTEKKYRCKKDFADLEARNTFKIGKKTIPIIKCSCGCNNCGLRKTIIKNNIVKLFCTRYKRVET